jgi:hypothetical protein
MSVPDDKLIGFMLHEFVTSDIMIAVKPGG